MTGRLFPQLPDAVARDLALARSTTDVGTLAEIATAEHPAATFEATGGARVPAGDIDDIRAALVDAARLQGYPGPIAEGSRGSFDAKSGEIVLTRMRITPAEASNTRIWSFLGCVVVPDLVRWRFPGGDGTAVERFIGGPRGIRNLLGRVWWRAYLLDAGEGAVGRWNALEQLGEDELVQITERPNIAGNRRLARQLCDSFLEGAYRFPRVTRSDLMREGMKQTRRLAALLSFDGMDDEQVKAAVDGIFERAGSGLGSATRASTEIGSVQPRA